MQMLPLAPSPSFVLAAELLQGATFALAYSAGEVGAGADEDTWVWCSSYAHHAHMAAGAVGQHVPAAGGPDC